MCYYPQITGTKFPELPSVEILLHKIKMVIINCLECFLDTLILLIHSAGVLLKKASCHLQFVVSSAEKLGRSYFGNKPSLGYSDICLPFQKNHPQQKRSIICNFKGEIRLNWSTFVKHCEGRWRNRTWQPVFLRVSNDKRFMKWNFFIFDRDQEW